MEAIQDAKLAQRLRSTADGMKSQIEAKLHPAIGKQRATARRARIVKASSIREEQIMNVLRVSVTSPARALAGHTVVGSKIYAWGT